MINFAFFSRKPGVFDLNFKAVNTEMLGHALLYMGIVCIPAL